MRVELNLQRLQSRFGESLFKFCTPQFTVPLLTIVIKSMADTDDHPINEKAKMKHFHEQRLEGVRKADRLMGEPGLRLRHPGAKHHVEQRKCNAPAQVNRHTLFQTPAFKAKVPRQP